MPNNDTGAARSFHDATKLSYISLATKPPLYKSYPGLPAVALPPDAPPPDAPTLEAVGGKVGFFSYDLPDLTMIARLLHYSAGLIRRSNLRSAGEVHYRAAASAGALYPIELYLVCGELPGIDAGVYHYAPDGNALTRLRSGDYRRNLAAMAGGRRSVAEAPFTIVCSCVFWRSAWKYRERGYRYCFWDNGTILANMTAAAGALGHPSEVVAGFVDAEVDALLGLDSAREAAFCLIPVSNGDAAPPAADMPDAVDAGILGDERRTEYPETRALHVNSCLSDAAEVRNWREPAPARQSANAAGWPDSAPLGATIANRGSTRRFAREPMPAGRLEALLSASTAPIAADYGGGLIDTYLIVNAADGISPGAYYYSPENGELELLQSGEFREEAGHLCFEQALGADAGAVAFFMADLDAILSRLGNRGYRAAQLEAGIIGGRMYLCSHSMGLGATGMTFFDDAVTAFFSPHAAGKSLMFLVGLGVTHERNQVHPFRSRIGILKDSLARGAGGQGQPVPDWLYA